MILGAAIVDMSLLAISASHAYKESRGKTAPPAEDWKQTDSRMLTIWVVFWALAVIFTATFFLKLPLIFVLRGGRAGLRLPDGQRDLARHLGQQSDLERLRRSRSSSWPGWG